MTLFTNADLDDLARARHLLEHNSLAVRLTDYLGKPLEWGMRYLPSGAQQTIGKACTLAVQRATDLACWSLGRSGARWDRLHLGCTMATGALGGAAGLAALAVELPATTTIMLRSIAQIARAEGEDLSLPESRLACVQVLALGGASPDDDAMDSAYLTARYGLAQEMRSAASWLADQTARTKAAPPMVRLVQRVAARFGVVVKDKAVAQLVPVVGAVGGAAVNGFFMDHFQKKAAGHFTYRRLERTYGPDAVAAAYRALGAGEPIITVHPTPPPQLAE